MTHRKELLEKAIEVTCNSRQAEYGEPKINLDITASFWTTYIQAKYPGVTLSAEDVAWLNTLQKVSRATGGHAGDDTYLDAAAYAAIAGEVRLNNTRPIPTQHEFSAPYAETFGDGKATTFTYPFFIKQARDLVVLLDNVVQGEGYTVTNIVGQGGDVTFKVALAKGVKVTLRRRGVRS